MIEYSKYEKIELNQMLACRGCGSRSHLHPSGGSLHPGYGPGCRTCKIEAQDLKSWNEFQRNVGL